MARRGDIVRVIKNNDYGIPIGEKLIVTSGSDIDGQIIVWTTDGGTAALDWAEYRTEETY